MTTTATTTALIAVAANGVYGLCGLDGVDVHAFTTEGARANFIARSPETRRIADVSELGDLPVRHWALHEDSPSDRALASMAFASGSVTFITYEPGEAECLAFGW